MPTQPEELKPQEMNKPEMVTIGKAELAGLIERLDKQSKDIDMLKEVADKARMSTFKSRHQDFTTKIVKVNTYNGKVVMAWKSTKDEIYQDAQGRWHEAQKMEIITDDNQKVEMDYIDFVKKLVKVDAELVSRYSTPEGQSMLRLNMGGKQIDIDHVFVN